jgi:hypothetical protein
MNITPDDELPIPDDPNAPYFGEDHEAGEYVKLEPVQGCARTGLAICIVAAIGAGCLIYLALTWRS